MERMKRPFPPPVGQIFPIQSAGRTDGPLNTPHTRTDARFSHSLCLIPAEAKRSPSPCSADGQPAGYEALK
jgi:hypothetical protein